MHVRTDLIVFHILAPRGQQVPSNVISNGNGNFTIDYTPVNLTRATMHVRTEGVINSDYTYERPRDHNHPQYHGPGHRLSWHGHGHHDHLGVRAFFPGTGRQTSHGVLGHYAAKRI